MVAIVFDFLSVVFGVMFALQVTNWNESRSARASFERAMEDLGPQVRGVYFSSAERIALADCRKIRYKELADQLLDTETPRAGSPGNYGGGLLANNEFMPVVRCPSRFFISQIWRTENRRGTFDLMNQDSRQVLAAAFLQGDTVEALQMQITQLEARLQVLANSIAALSPSDRLHFYEILSELDRLSLLMEVMASQINSVLVETGLHLPDEVADLLDLRKQMREHPGVMREVYGDCVNPLEWPGLLDDEPEEQP